MISLDEPFALGNIVEADLGASNVLSLYSIAFGPTIIDDENSNNFQDRWMRRLADASVGQLQRPSRMPLDGNF